MKHITTNFKIMGAALSALFAAYIIIQLFVPARIGSTQIEVEIPEGSTFKQAVGILVQNNLIRDKNLFVLIGKIAGYDRKIRAGYYVFWGNMSPLQVFNKLREGKIIENEITIIEGDSIYEIAKKMAANKVVALSHFMKLANDKNFLNSLNIDAPSLEGYLYPQTYKFPKGARPENVLKLMVNKLREEFNGELRARAKNMDWTENQVLTLASIIEREAATNEERPLVSAVYHNRIKKGMPLQADPTAVYGVKNQKTKITRDDLRKKTDYNTYIIRGLPPGPIASPGIESIKAALYPADVPYIYFVSKNNGTHHFSKTLQEHNAAVKRLRILQEEAKMRRILKDEQDAEITPVSFTRQAAE